MFHLQLTGIFALVSTMVYGAWLAVYSFSQENSRFSARIASDAPKITTQILEERFLL
jgi:hypothetical protein